MTWKTIPITEEQYAELEARAQKEKRSVAGQLSYELLQRGIGVEEATA